VAYFQRFFPGVYSSPRWSTYTTDSVIPFRHFAFLFQTIPHIEAAEELMAVRAGAHGHALGWNGKDAGVKSATRALARKAYPEIPLVGPPAPPPEPSTLLDQYGNPTEPD
jgi:hypothetical protein